MRTDETARSLSHLFSELVHGAAANGFVLNTGDGGLLQALDQMSAAEASASTNGGATVAAHAQHVRYGLSLMNQWQAEGGNPFANAKWDAAWKVSTVSDAEWSEIRDGLRGESERWLDVLKTPREVSPVEYTGLVSSIVHLAYHFGAIRQISKSARGPKEGTF